MKLFDTHCHFDFDVFQDDFEHNLALAQEQGVSRILIPSVGPSNWLRIQTLAEKYSHLYYALGFHPYFLEENFEQHLAELELYLKQKTPQCIAIGECGLDFAIDVDPQLQEKVLETQFELARRFDLPVILHSRKAHNRLIQMVKAAKLPKGGVVHAFAGSYQQAMEWVRLGFFIGVGGTITYPRAQKTRDAIQKLALENLLIETDAPDMPILGYQGQPNHPAKLIHVLNVLVELRRGEKQSIASQLWKNSNFAFSICE
ncbi:TatD family hydrolase [Vibrio natriegens]|uniref:Deoxyribonuclease n=1 Tax=Vibrio natriegens NBRC 15636 = ATCC 14048 = DSM 759 TaxID=1219067 RepID=A0AAN0Y3T7_VIBNA|nr:TatD family hydrolase [Vibrio natriegens]ALR14754.1 deoxyribonuclease [Vibrio natriegens NBRC 15636 = ATCC 14048 = DSM 759]ANQ13381.1 deoxyribonuclease [Vibrio natriegens NBRC 15636 = ATCC 14048 = DSM 759]EPM41267.1 deoxyribonuclease [Vibrio natriegens NBRC 15636 = ATCC 14048 = DSM 759]MDX6027818.1 TatD family hydrolase [Vibrio natriegens NBRC 15636 = ATCC 14048 = DSM 759]UUI11123.1 TatD family hydrolase [Vibrio natriegens]